MYNLRDLREEQIRLEETFRSNFFGVGSIIINGRGKDIDFVSVYSHELADKLVNDGFIEDLEEGYDNDILSSFRRGPVNVILLHNLGDIDRFLNAVEVCKLLSDGNMSKGWRVAIHEIILNNVPKEEAIKKVFRKFGGFDNVEEVVKVELRDAPPLEQNQVPQMAGDF